MPKKILQGLYKYLKRYVFPISLYLPDPRENPGRVPPTLQAYLQNIYNNFLVIVFVSDVQETK